MVSVQLRAAVVNLHRDKSGAYGNAWKKRGEVISVLANLARKVDRLAAGGITRDENVLDTAVDLLVYAIKYQTFLADLDPAVAAALFDPAVTAPYSDGTAGFEALWATLPAEAVEVGYDTPLDEAVARVEAAFAGLERHFDAATPRVAVVDRAASAAVLTRAAAALVGAVCRADPDGLAAFVDRWKGP
jgi:hypothetical protein